MTGRVLLDRQGGWRERQRAAAPATAAPARQRRETVEFEEAGAEHASGDSSWTVGYMDLLLLLVTLFAALLGATYLQVNQLSAVEPEEIQPLAGFSPPVERPDRSEPDPAVSPTEAGPPAGSETGSAAEVEPAIWHAAAAPILSQEATPARPEPLADDPADEAPDAPEPAASMPAESPAPPEVVQHGAEPSVPPAFEALMDLVASRGEQEDLELLLDRHQLRLEVGDGILFDSGTADLGHSGTALIEELVTALQDERLKISLEGHTDDVPISTPQFPSNWELSSIRATTVARELIAHGIPQERIRVTGHADTRPRAPNDSDVNRALNRRVSLVLEMRDELPVGSL
ncbi:MAG: OmpA family protein [Thioalkalivibrio sp.]|nr:OmpA family protein [Thioalkalivibrio sp.]